MRICVLLKPWPQIPKHTLTRAALHQGLNHLDPGASFHLCLPVGSCTHSALPFHAPVNPLHSSSPFLSPIWLHQGHWRRIPGQQTNFNPSRDWSTTQPSLLEPTCENLLFWPPNSLVKPRPLFLSFLCHGQGPTLHKDY